jgi:hypothetical protein
VFFTPKGDALFESRRIPDAPPMPGLSLDPVQDLVRRNRERGIRPDFSSGAPRWKRDSDVPWAIEAAAIDALDPSDQPKGLALKRGSHSSRYAPE